MRRHRGKRTYTSAGMRVVASLVLGLATLPFLAASGTAGPGTPGSSPSARQQAPLSTLTVSTVDSSGSPVVGVAFATWQESNGVRGL